MFYLVEERGAREASVASSSEEESEWEEWTETETETETESEGEQEQQVKYGAKLLIISFNINSKYLDF